MLRFCGLLGLVMLSRRSRSNRDRRGKPRLFPIFMALWLYGALAMQLTGFIGYSQFALWVAYTSFDPRMHSRGSYLASICRNTRSIAYLFGFGSRIVSIFCAQGRQVNAICTFSVIRRRAGRIEPILDRGPNPRSAAHRPARAFGHSWDCR